MKKGIVLFVFLFCIKGFSQLNIPAHFAYVKGGNYKIKSLDSSQIYIQKIEPFYMYRFEVSVRDFETFSKKTNRKIPKQPKGNNSLDPVVNVTYEDAQAYCSWLKSVYKVNFRLPTKEEWQFAARGGNFENEDYIYNQPLPNEFVVYIKNAKHKKPSCISCMQPNEFGLYAMVGNVWEWTEQQLKGFTTSIMGGSCFESANLVKVTSEKNINMNHKQKDLGFRFIVSKEEFEKIVNKK